MKISAFVSVLVASALAVVSGMTDKATGISFPSVFKGKDCVGVGCRKKGPIKVYSVAMYASGLKDRLASLSQSSKAAMTALRKGAGNDAPISFVLEMNFKVGAEKMASAIAEGVSPRYSGPASDVDKLKDLIFQGVSKKGAATKGTKFSFDCSSDGVTVGVDGNTQGSVPGAGMSSAFCGIYLDDNTVSPPLRKNCLANWCLP